MLEAWEEWIMMAAGVAAAVGIVGYFAFYLWRLERVDALWGKIRLARGWETPKETFLGISWKADARVGALRIRAGYMDATKHRSTWTVFELEFDAPFPKGLEIKPRTRWAEEAVDTRLGEAESSFARAFQVHNQGRDPVSSPVMQPRLGELFLELKELGDDVKLSERTLEVIHGRVVVDHDRVKRFLDRYLEIGQEIAQMAGLEHVEGKSYEGREVIGGEVHGESDSAAAQKEARSSEYW